MRVCAQFLLFLAAAAAGWSADAGPLSITVERARGDAWDAVDPAIVFKAGDEIRFRLRSSEPGFLYILNETGTGERMWIFPGAGSATENRVEPDREYTIPSGDAAFRVADQPGYDIVYYILTSVRLPSLPSAMPPPERPPSKSSLLPRCNESSLRARGVCMDSSAGTRRVQDRRKVDTLSQLIGSSGKIFIYELRLAHR